MIHATASINLQVVLLSVIVLGLWASTWEMLSLFSVVAASVRAVMVIDMLHGTVSVCIPTNQ
jgi:ethanolamine transporter EutH